MALLTLPSILDNVCIYAVRISRMGSTKIHYKAMITQYIEFVNFKILYIDFAVQIILQNMICTV